MLSAISLRDGGYEVKGRGTVVLLARGRRGRHMPVSLGVCVLEWQSAPFYLSSAEGPLAQNHSGVIG